MTAAEGFNLPLAVDGLAHIVADPSSWDQDMWARAADSGRPPDPAAPFGCGSTGCFAGWTAHLAGERLVWRPQGLADGAAWVADEVDRIGPHGWRYTIRHAATTHLGLSFDDAGRLFEPFMTLDGLYDLVAEFAGLPEAAVRALVAARVEELAHPLVFPS